MQLTPEILQKFAETTVKELVDIDRGIVSIYLCGSLVMGNNPLLGGTTDIDLVVIHSRQPDIRREILRLTDEVHLDIEHHSQDQYRQGRELRVHPWMGPTVFNAKVLHDPRHFMDFTQATVRGQFHRSDYVLKRSHTLLEQAHQTWMALNLEHPESSPEVLIKYFDAVSQTANALAQLVGEPLTERRFLLEYRDRVETLEKPGLHAGVLGLLGGPQVDKATLESWLPTWKSACDALPESGRPVRLHPYRQDYYLRAFKAILGSGQPLDVLWPLLYTWTLAAKAVSVSDPEFQNWHDACQHLGLQEAGFSERIEALDAYLDLATETVDMWEQAQETWV
jgi:hypothetical protein